MHRLLTALTLTLLAASSASAVVLTGPVTNPADGHDYYLLTQDTWTNNEAEAVILGGHLAAINDAAENAYVFNTFATFGGTSRTLWIGLNDLTVEGTFVWSSGEAVTYTNFAPGEPNDGDATTGSQDYVSINGPQSGAMASLWDDDVNGPASTDLYGVVEVVPEPAAAGLLGAAGLLALLRRRKVSK